MVKKQLPPPPATGSAFIEIQLYDHIMIPVEKAAEFFGCLVGCYVMSKDYQDGEYVYNLKDNQNLGFTLIQGHEITNAIAAKKLEV